MVRYILLLLIIFSSGCGNKPNVAKKEVHFFDIPLFVENQLKMLEKADYVFTEEDKVQSKNTKLTIDIGRVKLLSSAFTSFDMGAEPLQSAYTESVYYDQTTQSPIVSYATTDKHLPIQNINIVMASDGKKPDRVIIYRFDKMPLGLVSSLLIWTTDEGFKIFKTTYDHNKKMPPQYETVAVRWTLKK